MGNFLQTITSGQQPLNPSSLTCHPQISLYSCSLQKIKQHYGLFKSICDSFLITKDKFMEIFQSSPNIKIQCWDRDNVGKVDGLELFTGLILLANHCTFKDKVKFWFVIFDFNQIKTISFVDTEYLAICLSNSIYRILNRTSRANEAEIVEWLTKYIDQKQRINVTKLYSLCKQINEIRTFFCMLKLVGVDYTQFKIKDDSQLKKKYVQNAAFQKQQKLQSIWKIQQKRQVQQKLQWHRMFSSKLTTPYNPISHIHSCQLSWCYGIKTNLATPFLLIQSQILYTTSTLLVLYDLKTNKQRYYMNHKRMVGGFIYNKRKDWVVSVEEGVNQKAVHIWQRDTLTTIKILDTQHPHGVKQMLFISDQHLLLTIGGNETTSLCVYAFFNTNLNEQTSQISFQMLYSYSYDCFIDQIVPIHTNMQTQQVCINIWDSFIGVCRKKQKIYFSEFQWSRNFSNVQLINETIRKSLERFPGFDPNSRPPLLKVIPYEYYQEKQNSHDQDNFSDSQAGNRFGITCAIALYINELDPNLRSFISNQENLFVCVVTGHADGTVRSVLFNSQAFINEDTLIDFKKMQTKQLNKMKNQYSHLNQSHVQSFQRCSVSHLLSTSDHLLISQSSSLLIFPLSMLCTKEGQEHRLINLLSHPYLNLFSPIISYFTTSAQFIILLTRQNDFIQLSNRSLGFQSEDTYQEQENLVRIRTLQKLDGDNRVMCLLEKGGNQHLVYTLLNQRKVLIINSYTHELDNVYEFSGDDRVTAMDAVYTDDDVFFFICGCANGKLYIRVDNQENPKFYDCINQIVQVKISKDASYLLVATVEKYLYFFTQMNKNFSSPRKLHFQNQIPMCMNFLDSNKMFTVNTSAKNVYLIQIPQLKHKNVQKENQRINISKMKIIYPSQQPSKSQSSSKATSLSAYKQLSPTCTYLGGELKYFLMSLQTGELLFFQTRANLETYSYINLNVHYQGIAQLAIVEEQNKFYSLGKKDSTLLEWTAKTIKSLDNICSTVKMDTEAQQRQELDEFQKLKQASYFYKLTNSSTPEDIYLFKGTKNQKLNQALNKQITSNLISCNIKGQKSGQSLEIQQSQSVKLPSSSQKNLFSTNMSHLHMRQPNLSLQIQSITGIQCYKKQSVLFYDYKANQQEKLLYSTSRFLINYNIVSKQQIALEEPEYKISCFVLASSQDKSTILYCLNQSNPKIYIHQQDQSLSTTHQFGIIHMTVYKDLVLSYGILENNSYSLNLHNFRTKQLINKRTTHLKIHEFICLNQQVFVSLKQIRIWTDLYPSQKIGKATCGVLMPNKLDICLGTDNGSISILSSKGIFTIINKAHETNIVLMKVSLLQSQQSQQELPNCQQHISFQLITLSKDDKIKIWNQVFNCKLMINIREHIIKTIPLVQSEEQRRTLRADTRFFNVRAMDTRQGKIVIALASGQVYMSRFKQINQSSHQAQLRQSLEQKNSHEYLLQENQHQSMLSKSQDDNSIQSNQSILKDIQKRQQGKNTHLSTQYQKSWQKVVQSHSCETNNVFHKFLYFTLHPILPLIVSAGNDRKIIFRNYQANEVLATYFSEQGRITCLKFSEKGHLLVLGYKNGTIKIFQFEYRIKQSKLVSIDLIFSQKFTQKQQSISQPINIQFSQCSLYFSVSFISKSLQPLQSIKQTSNPTTYSFVQLYKLKQQRSQSHQQIYYSLVDTLIIKDDQAPTVNFSNKYTKCVYLMKFIFKETIIEDDKERKTVQAVQPKLATKNICLIMFEQYLNQNKIRVNHFSPHKDKFTIYLIQQKTYIKKQLDQFDWLGQISFPALINVLQISKFQSEVLVLDQEKIKHESLLSFDEGDLAISAMCFYKKDTIIYGGTHGKLHLVRSTSLLIDKDQTFQTLRQTEMAISKTYVSQTSFISQMQISTDNKYLFVAGQLDQSILKYRIVEEASKSDIDYQAYSIEQLDKSQVYLSKQKFYNFTNNIQPLREQIQQLLTDVQGQEAQQGILQCIKVIGRRAYDRFNNICFSSPYLIYPLGPNLIIQHPSQPSVQQILPSCPSIHSYSPQISCIDMRKNILILATEEQCAKLFIWDIRARICLSEMEVACSVVYGIRLLGDTRVVFYGINSMFQLVLVVMDWTQRTVIALSNLLHTAVWKIKDITVIENYKNINQIKFVTCGVQHLSQWTIKTNNLIQKHYTQIPANVTFFVINYFKDQYILTGCQKGCLYLWRQQQLLQVLKLHKGVIRSLQTIPQLNMIISGGLDSMIHITLFQQQQLFSQVSKALNPHQNQIPNGSLMQQNPSTHIASSTFLTQFDIQSIVYSPICLEDKKKNRNNKKVKIFNREEQVNFFVGTRSGDVYFMEYHVKDKEFKQNRILVYGQDHQTITSTVFHSTHEIFYTLTISGKLEVWELTKLEKVFQYKFMKKAKKLYLYKDSLVVCFEKQIIFIELDIRDQIIKIDENRTLNFDGIISECCVSFNQVYIAIGLNKNQSNQILIYEIEKKSYIYTSPSLKYQIEFLDFSTDQKYVLYKDKFQQIGMIYLITLKRINTIFIQMKIQWQSQGLRISPKAQKIYCSYNCQNKITTICRLGQDHILVGDEMGTLRIFNYPPENDRLGELHNTCYTLHMNKINSIKQHKCLNYVATTAVYDRSLILWRKVGFS